MDDREEIETKWREEFDEMGEAGVREAFFRGTIQTNQRKEGFAYRWLEEKNQEQEKKDRRRGKVIRVALGIHLILVVVGVFVVSWFFGLIPWPFWR